MQWQPGATLEILQLRAQLLEEVRHFFRQRGVLEVDTPILAQGAITSPALDSLRTVYTGPGAPEGRDYYLHTSPEFFMKRLLAAGSGSIYQLSRVFRDGEYGHKHNPEFMLLEWYRVGFGMSELMEEVAALLSSLLGQHFPALRFQYSSYQALFQRFGGVDGVTASVAELKQCLQQHGHALPAGLSDEDVDAWKDLVLTQIIEPQLEGGWFVYHYPASQAALARISPDNAAVAERFEVYINGLELANGFCELTDALEQRARFTAENNERELSDKPTMPLDDYFLTALEAGLPACAGVAVGFDRVMMLAANTATIQDVMSFGFERV